MNWLEILTFCVVHCLRARGFSLGVRRTIFFLSSSQLYTVRKSYNFEDRFEYRAKYSRFYDLNKIHIRI